MKKKIFALFLAGIMAVSLVACGGGKDETTSGTETNTDTKQEEAQPEETAEDSETAAEENGLKSIEIYYGSNHYEMFKANIQCPDGAYFDEADVAKYEAGEMLSSVNVYDDVREYAAYVLDLASLEYYHNQEDAVGYGLLEQLYFDGKLREETAADYESYSQNVIDLGFQWEDKDVILLETKTTMPDYPEQTDLFVCVEYERDFWRGKEGGGVEDHLHAPALFGFFMYSTGFDDLTVDQCAWIAGELFGVDSGRTWPVEGDTEEAVVNVDASEIIGTWLQRDSDWEDTYTFNEDGTGLLVSGPEYPFTYEVSGDVLTLTYDVDDEEIYTISVSGDVITLVDEFYEEIIWDRQAEEAEEPEVEPVAQQEEKEETEEADDRYPFEKEIIGTWVDNVTEYRETFIFYEDGTGLYQCYDGGDYETAFTYSFLRSDYVVIIYEDGGYEGGFRIDSIDGDKMLISNDAVMEMPFDRQ